MNEKCVCNINGYRMKDTEARQKATTAGVMANAAMEKAVEVETKIAAAQTAANRAKTTADGAVVTARAAYTTAETADSNARAAADAAAEAQKTASDMLPLDGGTMNGPVNMNGNDIYDATQINAKRLISRVLDMEYRVGTTPDAVFRVEPDRNGESLKFVVIPFDGTNDADPAAAAPVPIGVGEPTKDEHAATRKFVKDAVSAVQAATNSAQTTPAAVILGASELVGKSLSRGGENVIRFLAFADAHQNNENEYITNGNRELGNAVGEVVKRMYVDFVSNLGDSAWASYTNTTEDTLAQLQAFNALVKPHIRGELILNCEGNHDDSVYSTIDNDGDGTTAGAKKLPAAAVYALVHPTYRDVVWDPAHGADGYYYRDFPRLKTRVICLNTEQGAGDGGVMEGYQLKWFAETALGMPSEGGWNVVTLAHHPLDWGNAPLFKDCANIVDAFVAGRNLDYTTQDGTKISADYSGKSVQYVGHFHGHTHAFCITRMQKYADGSYSDINAWQIGIPNACYSRNNHNVNSENERIQRFSTPETYNKTDEDGNRTSFNLISVDLDNKIIYADNYGAGIDRQVTYAFEETPTEPINQLPISTDADGNIYNGKGFKENFKLGSTAGEEQAQSGINMTGFIPFETGTSDALGERVVKIENAEIAASDSNSRIGIFNADKEKIYVIQATKLGDGLVVPGVNIPFETDDNGNITSVDLTQITYNRHNVANAGETKFIRLCGAGIDGDTVITTTTE